MPNHSNRGLVLLRCATGLALTASMPENTSASTTHARLNARLTKSPLDSHSCLLHASPDSMGGAGEAHCAILHGLLQRWGDRRFAHVLRAQPSRVRRAVIDAIDYVLPNAGLKHSPFQETYLLAHAKRLTNR